MELKARIAKAMVLVAAGALLTGCGSSERSRMGTAWDLASQVPVGTGTECTGFDSMSTRLSGRATTYYYNGSPVDNKVRLRFSGVDDRFNTDSDTFIKFYRWQATSETPSMDSAPLSFTVEKGTTGSYAISGLLTQLSMNDVHSMRAANAVPGTSAQEFFDNTVLVLQGLDFNWHAIKVVLYKSGSTLGQVDFLAPAFAANPNTYAQTHPMILNNLHPFWSQRTLANMTEALWVERGRSYCF
jgi:hypothetical protein